MIISSFLPYPRVLRTVSGRELRLPLFLPVYQPQNAIVPNSNWRDIYEIEGCIVNAFFLYKNRQIREAFKNGEEIHRYLGYDGLVMTDSGAFQGFTRRLFLENKTIVAFQEAIGADIISPLDLVTPPGDNRTVAEGKMKTTLSRIRKVHPLVTRSVLCGVQQGGRFFDLRRQCVETLAEIGVKYLALGSLVPFFNHNRNISFVGQVTKEARAIIGKDTPIHIYGAGDPVELPFYVALGADIFDSSSYGHYAAGGWYMTPYGAITKAQCSLANDFTCDCHICRETPVREEIFQSEEALAAHNLWTIVKTIHRLREIIAQGTLDSFLSDILKRHMIWFPESELQKSWESIA